MTQKFDIVPDNSDDLPKPSNDNSPHGSFSVYEEGKTPTIDFQLADGRREFLRYAHILHGEISHEDKKDQIKLLFSTHTVILKGYCLKEIYDLLAVDNLKSIRENDERFIHTVDEDDPFVSDIEILWRKEDQNPE